MTTDTLNDPLPAGKFLSPDAILLTSEQVERAVQSSRSGQNPDEQWQIYLQSLALEGIQEWFQKRAPELSIVHRDVARNTSMNGCPQIQVGHFRVNLVITDALEICEVGLPEAALVHPSEIAHFYVLMEVLEENEQVAIGGYVRHDQVAQLPVVDGYGWLNAEVFGESSDRLLLELQTLDPAAIPLPDFISTLRQQVINTGLWLRNQLDQAAQDLAWILLPPVALPSPLRPTRTADEQLNVIVSNLVEQQGIFIPPHVVPAYKILREGDRNVYLYVFTWDISSPGGVPEWSLLTILAAPSGTLLPAHTCLQLWDEQSLLVEQQAQHSTDGGYLYAQAAGLQDETFSIRVQFSNQSPIQFPPFRFDPTS